MTDEEPGGALVDLPRPTEDRADYLRVLLADLWPGSRVSQSRPGRSVAPGGVEYLLFPSAQRPTVCVPAEPRRGTAAVVRGYKPSAGRRTQIQLAALGAGARAGLMRAWPHRLVVTPHGGESIETYLSESLRQSVVVTIYTSPPRANRKPVLRVLTAAGEPLAFAKLGVNSLTSRLVTAEADALARLAGHDLRHVVVPELLHRGQWNGVDVVVQRELTVAAPRPITPRNLVAAMQEISAIGGVGPVLLAESSYLATLRMKVSALAVGSAAEAFGHALDEVESLARTSGVRLAFGAWHGDWTPWNMTSDGERAFVWDWERFAGDVPVGFDAVHLRTQRAIVRDGVHARQAVERLVATAPGLLAEHGVERTAAQVVAALYLVELGHRYTVDGQADAGARLGNLDAWLLPGLRDALAALQAGAQ